MAVEIEWKPFDLRVGSSTPIICVCFLPGDLCGKGCRSEKLQKSRQMRWFLAFMRGTRGGFKFGN